MQTKTTLQKIARALLSSFVLVMCMMVTLTGKTIAEQPVAEVPLTVKKVYGEVSIFKTIKVQVENLEKWVALPNHDPSKFILYIDGNAVKGLQPILVDHHTALQFDLRRISDNKENKDAWTAILSRGPRSFSRTVPIAVGIESGVSLPSAVDVNLVIINQEWFTLFILLSLAAITLFWGLAYKSDIIRDTGPQPEGGHRKPFSLARTQMALWFFVVIISYVFIWMVMKDLYILTPSVLGLIGISSVTALGSAVVDSSKRSEQPNKLRIQEEKKSRNEVEAESLQRAISMLAVGGAPKNLDEQNAEQRDKVAELAARRKEINQANKEIEKLTKPLASKGFISDILSDDEGISFHRFQIFTWTIVLIVIFIWSVYNVLAMPEFDATLLGLMGISSGTYIGFKLPDQQG